MSLAKNPPMVYYTELKYAKDDIKINTDEALIIACTIGQNTKT